MCGGLRCSWLHRLRSGASLQGVCASSSKRWNSRPLLRRAPIYAVSRCHLAAGPRDPHRPGGNHGLAVAYAGWARVAATLSLPDSVAADKIAKLDAWGARVAMSGEAWATAPSSPATRRDRSLPISTRSPTLMSSRSKDDCGRFWTRHPTSIRCSSPRRGRPDLGSALRLGAKA